jgi:CRISPR-associated protein Cas5d
MKPVEKPEAAKRGNKIGFRWRITRLGVVRKGVLVSILRNELGYGSHPAYGNAQGFEISDARVRAQRHSLILSGGSDANGNRLMLEYLIEARLEVEDGLGPRGQRGQRPRLNAIQMRAKYHQMFLRRAAAGQCYYQPFFGCREFSVAEWALLESPPERISGAPETEDFGCVFRDFDFAPVWQHWGNEAGNPRPGKGWSVPRNRPVALRPLQARAEWGWIRVPEGQDGKEAPVL